MLTTTCPSCGASYNVQPEHVGKQIRCKKCQSLFPISDNVASAEPAHGFTRMPPAQQPDRAEEVRREREHQAQQDAQFTRRLVWIGAAAGVAIVLGIVVYFATRDTWERDNEGKLAALKAEIETARTNGELQQAHAKAEEILTLIGARKLKQANTSQIHQWAEAAKSEIADELAEKRAREERERADALRREEVKRREEESRRTEEARKQEERKLASEREEESRKAKDAKAKIDAQKKADDAKLLAANLQIALEYRKPIKSTIELVREYNNLAPILHEK